MLSMLGKISVYNILIFFSFPTFSENRVYDILTSAGEQHKYTDTG